MDSKLRKRRDSVLARSLADCEVNPGLIEVCKILSERRNQVLEDAKRLYTLLHQETFTTLQFEKEKNNQISRLKTQGLERKLKIEKKEIGILRLREDYESLMNQRQGYLAELKEIQSAKEIVEDEELQKQEIYQDLEARVQQIKAENRTLVVSKLDNLSENLESLEKSIQSLQKRLQERKTSLKTVQDSFASVNSVQEEQQKLKKKLMESSCLLEENCARIRKQLKTIQDTEHYFEGICDELSLKESKINADLNEQNLCIEKNMEELNALALKQKVHLKCVDDHATRVSALEETLRLNLNLKCDLHTERRCVQLKKNQMLKELRVKNKQLLKVCKTLEEAKQAAQGITNLIAQKRDIILSAKDLKLQSSNATLLTVRKEKAELKTKLEKVQMRIEKHMLLMLKTETLESKTREAFEEQLTAVGNSKLILSEWKQQHSEQKKQKYLLMSKNWVLDREIIVLEQQLKVVEASLAREELNLAEYQQNKKEYSRCFKRFSELYESVKSEKNKCMRIVLTVYQKTTECAEKVNLLNTDSEILKNNINGKVKVSGKLKLMINSGYTKKEGLILDLNKSKEVKRKLNGEFKNLKAANSKLKSRLKAATRTTKHLNSMITYNIKARNLSGLNIVDINEEISLLGNELIRIHESKKNKSLLLNTLTSNVLSVKHQIMEQRNKLEIQAANSVSLEAKEAENKILKKNLEKTKARLDELCIKMEDESTFSKKLRTIPVAKVSHEDCEIKLEVLEKRMAIARKKKLDLEISFSELVLVLDKAQSHQKNCEKERSSLLNLYNKTQARYSRLNETLVALVAELSMMEAMALLCEEAERSNEENTNAMKSNLERNEAPNEFALRLSKNVDYKLQLERSDSCEEIKSRAKAYLFEEEGIKRVKFYGKQLPFEKKREPSNLKYFRK